MDRLDQNRQAEQESLPPTTPTAPSALIAWLVAISVPLVGSLVVGCGLWWGYEAWRWSAFSREEQAIEALVGGWRDRSPPGIDPHVWREVVGTVDNALGNVCYSPDHVSLDEMRRLRAEVEAKSREPITVETLDWLWRRLGQIGPHGAKYATQMQPLWEEAREAAMASGEPR